MPLQVRCKSKAQAQNTPFWPQALPCQGFLPLGIQQPGMQPAMQQSQGSPCSAPIIVQPPAPAAPIVIQSPPMFVPVQTAQSADSAQNSPARSRTNSNDMRQQSQGDNMPVFTAGEQETHENPNQNDDFSAPVTERAQRQSGQGANSNSNAAAPPIIINIHNSQDTDSNNRSLFAPSVHDESRADTLLSVASRPSQRTASPAQTSGAEDTGISPVPVVKTPIPETTPGASLEPASAHNSQSPEIGAPLTTAGASEPATAQVNDIAKQETLPRFVLVRHGRLVHVRPVKAPVIELGTQAGQGQTPARTSKTMYHYVGWS